MAKRHEQPNQPGGSAPRVGGRTGPWVLFGAIVALVLIGDLGLKYWSFQHVAKTPILLKNEGGPVVYVPDSDGGGWVSPYERGETRDPAVIPPHEPTVVIPGGLNFQLTLNQGAVFGTGQGGRPVFIAVSIVATLVILYMHYRSPSRAWAYQAGLALILGGALGNLYDRARYAAVRDMLHMLPDTRLWPWIFNPADVALVVGVGVVLVVSWWGDYRSKKAGPSV
ncbi:MAG: signal peptidase II [Phycisphaeraceae bacterium]